MHFFVPNKFLVFICLENKDSIFNSNDLVSTFEKKKWKFLDAKRFWKIVIKEQTFFFFLVMYYSRKNIFKHKFKYDIIVII